MGSTMELEAIACEGLQEAERASIDTFSIQHVSDEIHMSIRNMS